MANNRFKMIQSLFMVVAFLTPTLCGTAFAAVGCELNDPDRDIKKAFPDSTGYKTEFVTIAERGGEKLKKEIEEKLGDKFDNIYESLDVPYTYYKILKGKETIGYMHGVNQKGMYGGMQLIIATNPDGLIKLFYYQKLSSPEARAFRDKAFTDKFAGLALEDFYRSKDPGSRLSKIEDPSKSNHEDFLYTLRGLKKNMILLDKFILKGDK